MQKDIFLVDADNTLLDFHASSLLSLKEAFAQFGIAWEEEYGKYFTSLNDELWAKLECKEITREELLNTRFPIYLERLKIKGINAEIFNQIFLETLAKKPVYMQGAEAFLTTIRSLGKVYIVTNGTTEIQKSRFSLCGLDKRVDGVFISQSIGYDKPNKGYTDYVVAHIDGFDANRAVWIGDSLSADIKSARNIGVESVWFNPKNEPLKGDVEPNYTVKNFEEIFHLLDF